VFTSSSPVKVGGLTTDRLNEAVVDHLEGLSLIGLSEWLSVPVPRSTNGGIAVRAFLDTGSAGMSAIGEPMSTQLPRGGGPPCFAPWPVPPPP